MLYTYVYVHMYIAIMLLSIKANKTSRDKYSHEKRVNNL